MRKQTAPLRILVYSDDANVREQVKLALGKRIHPELPELTYIDVATGPMHLLHLDCKHVGAGRIVVMSTPHAAESVARLVLSAMQCADHYFQSAVRNR